MVDDDDHSNSRKRKMDNLTDDDLLSDLPLHIIHCILALVPIRDAVRTCILSKQWRYKWSSLPHLVFDLESMSGIKPPQGNVMGLKNFITNALFLHQGPIQKFELSPAILNSCPDTDRWLLYLSRTEIRELVMNIIPFLGCFRLHSSLYSFRKLTHLHLYRCELPQPPLSFKGFSCLRSLVLSSVKVPSDAAIETLVSHSPLLDNFIYSYSVSSEFRISAPSLKCFELTGEFNEIGLYAPLLAEMSVSLSKKPGQQKSSVCNYTNFLNGLANLERLVGQKFFTKYLSIGIKSYDHSLVFDRLKIISLFQVNFRDMKEMFVVVCLMMDTPNLQELTLSTCPNASEAPPESFLDFGGAPNVIFNKLRVITMNDVLGLPSEMELIKFMLTSSTVLEMMTVSCSRLLVPEGISNLMRELLRYSRASPNAKILLK